MFSKLLAHHTQFVSLLQVFQFNRDMNSTRRLIIDNSVDTHNMNVSVLKVSKPTFKRCRVSYLSVLLLFVYIDLKRAFVIIVSFPKKI